MPVSRADKASLSVVVPAYNEEERLPALLDALDNSAQDAAADAGFALKETILIDDGSTDNTRKLLADVAGDPGLRPVLEFDENRGKGAAVALGIKRARGDFVLMADADLSTPLEEMRKLSDAIRDGADIAIGSRAITGAVVERGPFHRKLTGSTFSAAVRVLTGLRVRDTQCGFKLLPTRLARWLLADQMCAGFAFDVEMLMRADFAGLSIAEVPILYVHDSRSSVKVGSASLEMLGDVIQFAYQLRWRAQTQAPPLGAGSDLLAELPADDSD